MTRGLLPTLSTFAIAQVVAVGPVIAQLVAPAESIVTLFALGGRGTGSIVDASGLVLTSEHVIRRARRGQVSVRLADGQSYPARVVAVDRAADLAAVQILAERRFAALPLAAGELAIGQTAYALDRPFESATVTIRGTLQRLAPHGNLYTDLALSPSDSGGPLLDMRGQLIGVNKAVFVVGSTGTTYGIATDIATIRDFLARAAAGTAAPFDAPTPELGITVVPGTLEIAAVAPNSLAAGWGLQPGDRLAGLNQRPLSDLSELDRAIAAQPSELLLTVARGGYLAQLYIRL